MLLRPRPWASREAGPGPLHLKDVDDAEEDAPGPATVRGWFVTFRGLPLVTTASESEVAETVTEHARDRFGATREPIGVVLRLAWRKVAVRAANLQQRHCLRPTSSIASSHIRGPQAPRIQNSLAICRRICLVVTHRTQCAEWRGGRLKAVPLVAGSGRAYSCSGLSLVVVFAYSARFVPASLRLVTRTVR